MGLIVFSCFVSSVIIHVRGLPEMGNLTSILHNELVAPWKCECHRCMGRLGSRGRKQMKWWRGERGGVSSRGCLKQLRGVTPRALWSRNELACPRSSGLENSWAPWPTVLLN